MKTPKLTKKIVRNDLTLGDAISGVLTKSKNQRKLTKSVFRWQHRLQRAVGAEAWKVSLHLEEIVNERASFEQDVLIRWAFRQGRWYERR